MKTFLADEDVLLQVPLRQHGEPLIPDAGSVRLTVRGNGGAVLVNREPVTMATASTEASVIVPAVANEIGLNRFQNRTVIVEWTKTGRPMNAKLSYRLTTWLNTTVTADDVRGYIGVDSGELPDDVIDITDAYLDVEQEATETVLTAALAGGDSLQRQANRMILARAVLKQLPGLPLRLSQSESNGVFSATRPKVDLGLLEMRALADYGEALGLVVTTLSSDPTLFLVVPISPDPITGV